MATKATLELLLALVTVTTGAGTGLNAAPACMAGDALASLTPPPQRITKHGAHGAERITSAWRIAVAGSGSQHAAALAELAQALAGQGLPAPRVVDAAGIGPTEEQLILLGVPAAEPSVAKAAGAATVAAIRSLPATPEAHVLSIGAGRVLALGSGPSGAFYSVQTLVQLLNASRAALPSCLIEDFPDSPLRGFRIWAAPVSLKNTTWVDGMVDLMTSHKMNFGPISANAFYSQPFDNLPWPANATADRAFLRNVKAKFDSRFLEMVPDFNFGSMAHQGLSALFPGISEGLWAKNEPFTVAEDMQLTPVADPITAFPLNGDFQVLNSSSGNNQPAHWTIHPPGSITGEPGGKTRRGSCYVDSRDPPPADSRGRGDEVMRCDVWCDPAGGPCQGSPGFESEQIEVKAGDILYMSAWTKTEANCSVPNGGPELLLGHEACILFDPDWKGCSPGAGTAIPRTEGKWKPFGVTFHAASDVNLTVSTRMKGESESIDNCSWSVAHPRILRVNSALLNVLQTNSTDVNVSAAHVAAADGGTYTRNVDFEVVPPTKAKITGGDTDMWALYNKSLANRSAWGYTVRALPGGKLRAGDEVRVSYDVSAGAVGWGDWTSNPQAFGEAGFYESSCIILAEAIKLARPKHVMTGMDEVRGVNRDSRSRRLGLSNGRIFAHAMNKLAACIHRASAENGLDVKPLFWADMVSPVHNGGIYGYQSGDGGFPGNSSEAMQYLDPTIGLIPWYYGSSDEEVAHLNASDHVCEGRLSPLPPNESALATPLQWIGGSGSNTPNVAAWAANLAASKHGLGMLGTEWHFEQPDLSALPATAAFSWNHQGSSNVSCSGVVKTDDDDPVPTLPVDQPDFDRGGDPGGRDTVSKPDDNSSPGSVKSPASKTDDDRSWLVSEPRTRFLLLDKHADLTGGAKSNGTVAGGKNNVLEVRKQTSGCEASCGDQFDNGSLTDFGLANNPQRLIDFHIYQTLTDAGDTGASATVLMRPTHLICQRKPPGIRLALMKNATIGAQSSRPSGVDSVISVNTLLKTALRSVKINPRIQWNRIIKIQQLIPKTISFTVLLQ